MILTCSLQSGSNGNAIYVEHDGVRLLFDAGITARQAKLRLAQHGGRTPHGMDGIILSHDHSDHTRHAGVMARMFRIPLYCTELTYGVVRAQLGRVPDLRHFRAGEALTFGDGKLRVTTIPTPHDAADGVCFVVESAESRLGIFTDLGHPFLALHGALRTVDAAYLESNYDPQMLATGPYPEDLKRRIRGEHGHISNEEAAELLAGCGRRFKWVALAHLSHENNHPDVALRTHRARLGPDFPLWVATRHSVSALQAV